MTWFKLSERSGSFLSIKSWINFHFQIQKGTRVRLLCCLKQLENYTKLFQILDTSSKGPRSLKEENQWVKLYDFCSLLSKGSLQATIKEDKLQRECRILLSWEDIDWSSGKPWYIELVRHDIGGWSTLTDSEIQQPPEVPLCLRIDLSMPERKVLHARKRNIGKQ